MNSDECFVSSDTRLLVRGITGKEGQFHTRQCVAYGTRAVAGVTPGKGSTDMDGIPVFNGVRKRPGNQCQLHSMILFLTHFLRGCHRWKRWKPALS
ncbi:MAG: hypothetical protein R2860_06020 [Desulfobacterales bacterium]